METLEGLIDKLDKKDKEKVIIFAKELLKQKKYAKLRKELSERRKQIEKGEVLTHKDIWDWNFPNITNIKALKSHPLADYRLRVGDYRILFDVDWENKKIYILKITWNWA